MINGIRDMLENIIEITTTLLPQNDELKRQIYIGRGTIPDQYITDEESDLLVDSFNHYFKYGSPSNAFETAPLTGFSPGKIATFKSVKTNELYMILQPHESGGPLAIEYEQALYNMVVNLEECYRKKSKIVVVKNRLLIVLIIKDVTDNNMIATIQRLFKKQCQNPSIRSSAGGYILSFGELKMDNMQKITQRMNSLTITPQESPFMPLPSVLKSRRQHPIPEIK